ncbi:MAG: DUF4339 domain-containing protein [Bdellovibrionaceae bacterium]|nr:DUF4339 domain-containing protein [Pseudobdellovibrionaceae bacterium]
MLAKTDPRNQWYILRGEDKYGPFEYMSMVRMMQNNELYDYNYVWAPHLESWTLAGELADFSQDRMARLIESGVIKPTGSFIDRQADRADIVVPVYGHNGHMFFDGQSLSISANGSLLLLNTPLMLPGQEFHLHFRNGGANKTAFNVRAQIVRKNYTRTRINVKSGLHYAVRFIQISRTGEDVLKELVKEHSKEAKQ